jgi:hypothetical protein
MDRRKALALTATIFGGAIVGSQIFLAGCKKIEKEALLFSDQEVAFLDEVGETIIPTSKDSPGAKAAGIGAFMKTIITDCYSSEEANTFYKGISEIENKAKQSFSKGFMQLNDQERFQLFVDLDKASREKKSDALYFSMMKELTLWGYFSSEVGCTQALRYNPIPGRFEGCVPYNGEPAWA